MKRIGADRVQWPIDEIKVLTNPALCLTKEPIPSEEQRIRSSVQLIAEIGPEQYLASYSIPFVRTDAPRLRPLSRVSFASMYTISGLNILESPGRLES